MNSEKRSYIISFIVVFALICVLAYVAYATGFEAATKNGGNDDGGAEVEPQAPVGPPQGSYAAPPIVQTAPAAAPVQVVAPAAPVAQNGHQQFTPAGDGSPYVKAANPFEGTAPLVPETLE